MLIGSWAVLSLTALLIAEVNLRCHEQAVRQAPTDGSDPNRVIPLPEMTRMTLGATGEAGVSAIYLTLTFTLLLAYTARAGGLIDAALPFSTPVGTALFTGAIGGTLALTGTGGAERMNSALTVGMLVLFAGVVAGGALQVDWNSSLAHADWSVAAPCLPVMFLALVYHDLIPVVCQFLGFDRTKVTQSLLSGSVLPLGMFVAWEAVCLGLVPFSGDTGLDPVDVLIESQGALGGSAIAAFSLAALATSAIGVTLSLSSFFKNKLSEMTTLGEIGGAQSASATPGGHVPSVLECTALLLTLMPPTIASMGNTDVFLPATHVAGAYGMTLLYGLLPPLLAWRWRGNAHAGERQQLLAGGKPVLLGLVGAGAAVEVLQLRRDLADSSTSSAAFLEQQPVYEVAVAADAALSSVSATAASWSDAALSLPVAVSAAPFLPL